MTKSLGKRAFSDSLLASPLKKGSPEMQKILVVDNHPVMLKFMGNLLGSKGHKVLTAHDGLSALDVLKTFTPDVMFIDLIMPNIGGEKLCRVIRNMPEFKDVCLVILSGVALEQDIDFKLLGVDACIAKGPFDKMSKHVLSVLDQLEQGGTQGFPEKVMGIDSVFEREVSKELLSSKMHLESIMNNMSEGILELNPELRIVYANPAAISFSGFSEEKLLSLSFIDIIQGTYNKTSYAIEDLLEKIGDEPLVIGEDSPMILNGRRILLNILQLKEAKEKSTIVIMNDIGERKRMEEQLRQAQKMESITTLAGGIAHQFNNALSVITGNIELLKMSIPDGSEYCENIEPIKQSAYRMSNLTSQLLAYARGGKYNPKTISLSTFVKDTIPLIRHSISHGIRIETHLPEYIPNIEADLTQIQMILSAVVTNAAEAIEGKGCLRITAEEKVILEHNPNLERGRYACLTIEDNGKGMDDEIKNRMFEPFFTTNFQGRGLGMAAAFGIIRNHGGWISVESELGKGTQVHIYLPAVESLEKEIRGIEPKLEVGSGTILIIDDESMILEVCRTMLEKLSYNVLEARTGAEAINVTKNFEGDIDLALLDIGLPDMDGDKLFPFLKEARNDLKVIVCSGYSIDGPAQEILDAGADGFIQKPYAFGALSVKLKEVLGTAS